MILVEQVATYLGNQIAGLTLNDNLHPGYLPSSPPTAVAVIDAPSFAPHKIVELVNPAFVVLCRGSYSEASAQSWAIYAKLQREEMLLLTVGGLYLRECLAQNIPTFVQVDDNGLVLFSTTYNASAYEAQLTS